MAGEEEKKKPKKSFGQKTREGISSCCKFMYNSEDKTVMGRTGISWLQILTFYVCFYAVIAGIWAICMAAFLATLDPHAPTQTNMYSMLKNNPGMGFWPTSDGSGTIINLNSVNSSTYDYAITQLDPVVGLYNDSTAHDYLFPNCNFAQNITSNLSVGCAFDPSLFGPCNAQNNYGYDIGKPCALLRINKIYGWDPKPLFDGGNSTNEYQFNQIPTQFKTTYTNSSSNHFIPISCQPESDADYDNINQISFYPQYGIDTVYFPYYNQAKYQPPAVMAQFDIKPGVLVMVWCKFWTKNVIFDQTDLQGSVHIELFVQNNVM